MQRTKPADGAVLDINGNYIFADPNPPQQGTLQTAAWFNSVQEELAHLVESSGQTLADADNYQVMKAVRNANAILSNLTLNVTGVSNPATPTYLNLAEAFDALRGRYIGPTVVVTIQLQTSMTHTQNQPLFVTHPQGERIVIKGDDANPSATILSVDPHLWPNREMAAITVEAGGRIGGMSGFTIQPNLASGYPSFPVCGLKASSGGRMKLGNVIVKNWPGTNIFAKAGGVIIADGTVSQTAERYISGTWTAEDLATHGVCWMARDTGFIEVANSVTTGEVSSTFFRCCFRALTGGVIRATDCQSIGGTIAAERGGIVHAFACLTKGTPTGSQSRGGFYANYSGTMYLNNCSTNGTGSEACDSGLYSFSGSSVYAEGCTMSNCTSHGARVATGSKIATDGGGLTLTNNGGYGITVGKFCYVGRFIGTGNTSGLSTLTGADTAIMSYTGL